MATAVVDGKPALCPIDPVLNQIAACASVTVWSMVVFPSDFDLLGHATSCPVMSSTNTSEWIRHRRHDFRGDFGMSVHSWDGARAARASGRLGSGASHPTKFPPRDDHGYERV
jgi:hypothetical protein